MTSYAFLSEYYDLFTDDVPYDDFINYYTKIFEKYNLKPEIILDLACGTGNISIKFANLGYDVIGVDLSSEMLMRAMDKSFEILPKPLFLCQSMDELDLYGTVDACVCALDSINYVTDIEILRKSFAKVELFLHPGGVFIFDINSAFKLNGLNGNSYVRQNEDVFCVWQVDIEQNMCTYEFDFFEKGEGDNNYHRYSEIHKERIYQIEELTALLRECGFIDINVYGELNFNAPKQDEMRIFFSARKNQ